MKIYIVTSGEYSDYGIDAVFTKEETANMYANLNSDRRVEVYDADSVSVMYRAKENPYSVTYDIIEDRITSMYQTADEYANEDFMSDTTLKDFYLYVYPSKRVYEDMAKHSWGSELLLKIVRDRFAKYCAEHETSREELIRVRKKREADFYRNIGIATTSSDFSGPNMHDPAFNPYYFADRRMQDVMKKYQEEHGKFPDIATLKTLYSEQVTEVLDKHEHDELR